MLSVINVSYKFCRTRAVFHTFTLGGRRLQCNPFQLRSHCRHAGEQPVNYMYDVLVPNLVNTAKWSANDCPVHGGGLYYNLYHFKSSKSVYFQFYLQHQRYVLGYDGIAFLINSIFASQSLLHACLDRGNLSIEKFSRWLRTICTILLSRNSQADRLKAINYVEQALTVLEEQNGEQASTPSEVCPA